MIEMNRKFCSTRHRHISSAANKKNVEGQTQTSYQNEELKLLHLKLYDYFHYMTEKRPDFETINYLLLKKRKNKESNLNKTMKNRHQ